MASSHANVFVEDFTNGIMSHRAIQSGHVKVTCVPNTQDAEYAMAMMLSAGNRHRGNTLTEVASYRFREIVRDMLVFGVDAYELADFEHSYSAIDIANLEALGLNKLMVLGKIPSLSFQVSGEGIVQRWSDPDTEPGCHMHVYIPRRRTVIFELADEDQDAIDSMLKSLVMLDSVSNTSQLYLEELKTGSFNFDVDASLRQQTLALLELTAVTGWNARNSVDEKVSEFYLMVRLMRMEWLKLRTRNAILGSLNLALANIAAEWGQQFSLCISGFPTAVDIESAERDLRSGSHSFKDIWERFR